MFQEVEAYLRTSEVNKEKQLIVVFPQCLTETRKNEARLCRARILTMFQEERKRKKQTKI